jgi:hypothetical protein
MAGARLVTPVLFWFALHGEGSALHKIAMQQQCRCTISSSVQTAQICSPKVRAACTCIFFAAIAASSAAATPTAAAAAAAAANAAAEEANGWFTGAAARKREKRVIVIVGTAGKTCKRHRVTQAGPCASSIHPNAWIAQQGCAVALE